MAKIRLFPSGIAEGEAFCNREQERYALLNGIAHLEHTVLVAPRRYGKTSLISEVMRQNDIEHAWIELLSVTSFESVQSKITETIGELLYRLSPDVSKLATKFKKYFSQLRPEIVLSGLEHITDFRSGTGVLFAEQLR